MFDRQLLALTKPMVDATARRIVARRINATQVTLAGFAFGLIATAMIAAGLVESAIVPMLLNRLCDGLDGAVARTEGPTDRGAFLDITLDFAFYAGVPLAFAFCNPSVNALPAAVLLASFIGTGVTFLAFAIMAAKHGKTSPQYPAKAFYYLGGLAEGSETVLCFALMCLWRDGFPILAYVYAGICLVTTLTRLAAGWQTFKS